MLSPEFYPKLAPFKVAPKYGFRKRHVTFQLSRILKDQVAGAKKHLLPHNKLCISNFGSPFRGLGGFI